MPRPGRIAPRAGYTARVTGLIILFLCAGSLVVLLLVAVLVVGMRRPPAHTAAYALARGLPCDPAGLGFAFESWTVDRPDGVRLPVWEFETGAAEGPTAVLLHGWGQGRVDLLDRLTPWECGCRRLVLMDLRGHGDSEGGPSRLGDPREEEDVAALLDQLGAGPVVLVGFSLGAALALHAAARRTRAEPPIVGVAAYGLFTDFHTALRGRLQAGRGCPGAPLTDLALAWFRWRGVRPRSVLDAFSDLDMPILLLHQTEDPVSPVRPVQDLAAGAENVTLAIIEGEGHLNVRAVDPEAHDAAVASFLDRVTGRD